MSSRLSFLVDLAIFQVAWFACVLAILSPFPRILPLAGMTLVLVRVLLAQRLKHALPFLLACAILGVLGDAPSCETRISEIPPLP